MWVEYEKYDFVKGRVRSERRWIDLGVVVQNNALLSSMMKDAVTESKRKGKRRLKNNQRKSGATRRQA
jgi:hypothetical protein